MKFRNILLLALAICASGALSAQTATVIRMTGDKTATLINASGDEIALAVGMELAEGDLVSSNANTKVFIRTFEGAITTLAADSVLEIVKVEKISDERELTRLRLQSGNVVANLDPNKRGVHDYSVDTPKGVAAARGTSYSVSVDGLEVLVTVSGGAVSFQIPNFPEPVSLTPGSASSGGSSISLAAALSNPATAAAVNRAMQATAAAVATLMTVEGSGVTSSTLNDVITAAAGAGAGSGGTGDNGALVAVVAAAATQANPAVANEVVQSAVVATAGTPAAATVANTVVASVTKASSAATGRTVAETAAELAQTANTASNGAVTVDSGAVENAVNESNAQEAGGETAGETPAQETDEGTDVDETEIEIEVPTDNIIVSPSS